MTSAELLWTWAAAARHFEALEDRMTSPPYTHRPDGTPIKDRNMSRPKDQDQDEPDTPPATQTRTLGWNGYNITVRELRGWLDKIPDQATIRLTSMNRSGGHNEIDATWEVP